MSDYSSTASLLFQVSGFTPCDDHPGRVNLFKNSCVQKIFWFQWNLSSPPPPSIISFLLNDTPNHTYTCTHTQEKRPHPCLHVEQPRYNACTSSTMDRVFTVPHMHPDVRGDSASAHQSGLRPHCLQDVPQQASSQGLSLWPDGHQHRHRAAARQLGPATAGWGSGEAFRPILPRSVIVVFQISHCVLHFICLFVSGAQTATCGAHCMPRGHQALWWGSAVRWGAGPLPQTPQQCTRYLTCSHMVFKVAVH